MIREDKQREIIELYWQGYTPKEIAKMKNEKWEEIRTILLKSCGEAKDGANPPVRVDETWMEEWDETCHIAKLIANNEAKIVTIKGKRVMVMKDSNIIKEA